MGIPRILMRPSSTQFFEKYRQADRIGYTIGRSQGWSVPRWMHIDSYIAGFRNGSHGCHGGWNWGCNSWGRGNFGHCGGRGLFPNNFWGKMSAGLIGAAAGFGIVTNILNRDRQSSNYYDNYYNPYELAQQQQQQLEQQRQQLLAQSKVSESELNQVNGRYNLSA